MKKIIFDIVKNIPEGHWGFPLAQSFKNLESEYYGSVLNRVRMNLSSSRYLNNKGSALLFLLTMNVCAWITALSIPFPLSIWFPIASILFTFRLIQQPSSDIIEDTPESPLFKTMVSLYQYIKEKKTDNADEVFKRVLEKDVIGNSIITIINQFEGNPQLLKRFFDIHLSEYLENWDKEYQREVLKEASMKTLSETIDLLKAMGGEDEAFQQRLTDVFTHAAKMEYQELKRLNDDLSQAIKAGETHRVLSIRYLN